MRRVDIPIFGVAGASAFAASTITTYRMGIIAATAAGAIVTMNHEDDDDDDCKDYNSS